MTTITEITALPRERWAEAWLQAHDPQYVKPKAPRRTLAQSPQLELIVTPITAQAASGDGDLASVHVGGRMTTTILRRQRIDRHTRHAIPLAEQWGVRHGHGKDGLLRRGLDREYRARQAGQRSFTGPGFDVAAGGAA